MDFDISEKVKEWASEGDQELDGIIKEEIKRQKIQENLKNADIALSGIQIKEKYS